MHGAPHIGLLDTIAMRTLTDLFKRGANRRTSYRAVEWYNVTGYTTDTLTFTARCGQQNSWRGTRDTSVGPEVAEALYIVVTNKTDVTLYSKTGLYKPTVELLHMTMSRCNPRDLPITLLTIQSVGNGVYQAVDLHIGNQ